MGTNGVFNGDATRIDFHAKAKLLGVEREENKLEEAARLLQMQQRYDVLHSADGESRGVDEEDFVEVAGFSGTMKNAPRLSRSKKPPKGSGALWVEKVKPGTKGSFLVYSPCFHGFDTHYTGKGTVLCFENHELCAGGHNVKTLRWHGFLHCYSHEQRKPVFLHFTPGGAHALFDQIADGTSLRGLQIEVSRSPAKKGPFYVKVKGVYRDLDTLPPHLDPRASVFRLFKLPPAEGWNAKMCSDGADIPDDRQE